ncbi:MAG TPA: glycosyltransferase family 1 protein [Thermoanaerobaculia bacterium]|nr:glycosyltransferase family 1 protein [Thermoanaerobaculia bacterium]
MIPLRVGIDARPLVGNRTGIGVHTAEIAQRLETDPPPLLLAHREIADRSGVERCRFRVDSSPLGFLWQQTRLPAALREEGCEVFWGPHGTLPFDLPVPAVATVHDLTSLTRPGLHRLRTVASFNLLIGASLRAAAAITAVSTSTADELVRGFGISPSRITVVPNAVDEYFSPADEEPVLPFGLSAGSYVLYAGTLEPRKGIADLVAAWEQLRPRPRLVLAGGRGWKIDRFLERVCRRHGESLLITGFVDRAVLRDLYRGAICFVYPSHDEGFGIPPLEAMACGTPVIASDAGALRETVGEGALVVRKENPEDLRRALERLLRDPGLRRDLRERGVANVRRFDWGRSASILLEVLRRVAR